MDKELKESRKMLSYEIKDINKEIEIIKKNQIESWNLNVKGVLSPSAVRKKKIKWTFWS